VFPFLEPFGESGFGAPDLAEDKRVPRIYSETNQANRAEAGLYTIRVRSASGSSEINLGFNIIENSEIIRLNNRTLERGKDYNIEYNFGRITFVGAAQSDVADPTADLDISYQNSDLFGFGQSKSLLGVRLERPFDDQYSLIGMTLLYSNQTTPSQRIRVGQEPARTIIWDANARFRFKPQSLTDWVNSIPLVNTQAPSTVDLDFEVAQSLPNPNTKNVAYIDDFEGAENSQSFQIGKIVWSLASTPIKNNATVNLPKARLTWYNPVERDRASLTQIQPNRDDITIDQNIVDILALRFDPARGNAAPYHVTYDTNRNPRQSWAGIMRYLNGLDLSRAKFLELWIRGDNGQLHIDLGEISERVSLPLDHPTFNDPNNRDQYPNGFRTEDNPLGNLPTGDDVASPEEDIGLDRLTDADERRIFSEIFPGLNVPDDPSIDNFRDVSRSSTNIKDRYPTGLNGTSGNNAERNSRPDSEDLNSNGFLDARESFIRYSVDLATDTGLSPQTGAYGESSVLVPGTQSNAFVELGGASNPPWRLLRIPLKGQDAPRTLEGSPDTTFSNAIDYVRFWVEHNDTTTVELYTFKSVGSDWQEDLVQAGFQSGDFQVSTIGTDNSFYIPPPSLEREIDPTTGVRISENSLSLEFSDLIPGDGVSASRNFLQNSDYTRYGTLSMFIHGGNPADQTYSTTFPAAGDSLVTGISPVEAFLRFTPINDDTTNFYEYRSRVYRGWETDVNTINVNLELMSQLKGQLLDLQSTRQVTDTIVVALRQGDFEAFYEKERNQIQIEFDRSTYTVRGTPALSQIKAFTVGIRNRGPDILLGKSEIWFDELRVDDVRKKSAFSAVMDMRTTLADLGNFTINLERRSGDFQDLQGNASGNSTNRLNFDSAINIDKFLPAEWSTTIPIRFSYNRFTSVPRIRPGSDIVLTPLQQTNENDVRSQTRFNISWRKRPAPEKPRLISRVFFDKVNTSLNYSSNAATSGAITQRRSSKNQNLNGSFSYSQTWSQRPALKIFKWVPLLTPLKNAQFFYLPSSISYNNRFSRGKSNNLSFRAVGGDTSNVIDTDTENFNLNESYNAKFSPFRSLTADYQLGIVRDLRNGFSVSGLQFGRENSRSQTANVRYSPNISRWLRIDPSYAANYTERLETGGQRTQLGSVRKGLTVNLSNTTQARISFNLPSLFQALTRKSSRDTTFSFLKAIGKIGGSISAIQSSVTRTKSFNAFGLDGRPSLAYQFGLKDTSGVPSVNTGSGTRTNTQTVRDQAQASTGLRLPLGFQINTAANFSQNQSIGNTRTKDDQLTFPKVDFLWRGLEKVPLLGYFWTSSSANFSYQELHTRQGDDGLDNQSLTSDTREKAFNPLFQWTARWKGDINTSLRTNKSEQNTVRYQRNVTADTATVRPTLADRLIGTTLTKQNAVQADLSFSVRGRFERSLELNLGFQLGGNTQSELQRSAADTPAEPIIRQDGSNWSLNVGSQYAFSSRFTGGANFRHERRKDLIRDLTNVAWNFRFWGEIGFQ
jgi:cell surface protein SprA